MVRILLAALAALVLLVVMNITTPSNNFGSYISASLSAPGGGGIGSDRVQVAIAENDDPTPDEKQQLGRAAVAIGSLYFCDKAGLHAPKEASAAGDALLYQVAWSRMVDIFAPYEKFEGSPMFMGAMYISQMTNEAAINGFHMAESPTGEFTQVALDSAEVCMAAEAVLRTMMQPGKVLDGKWRVGQRGA